MGAQCFLGFAEETDTPASPELFFGLICTGGGETGFQLQVNLYSQPYLPRQAHESLGLMILFSCGDRAGQWIPSQGDLKAQVYKYYLQWTECSHMPRPLPNSYVETLIPV